MKKILRADPGRKRGCRVSAVEKALAWSNRQAGGARAVLALLAAGVWTAPAWADDPPGPLGLLNVRLTDGAAIRVLNPAPPAAADGVSVTISASLSGTSRASSSPGASIAGAVVSGEGAQASGVNAVAIGAGAQAGAANSVALGAGSTADRPNTVAVGAAGQERQVTHVADGTQDTDAANVRQLRSATGELQNGLNDLRNDLRTVERNANAGTASAMAVAGLPQPYAPGRSMAAAAASHYQGQSAIALGVSTISESGRWVYKFAGNVNSQAKVGAVIGAGFQW